MSESQIALVTGGNQGIGFEIVKKLAADRPDYKVLLGCRDIAKGREAGSKLSSNVFPVEVDITSNSSIAECVAQISEKYGRLDVLVNNAGIGMGSVMDMPTLTTKMDKIFHVNVMGTAEMTEAAIPLLEEAQKRGSVPRVVFITSEMGSLANTLDPEWKYYAGRNSIPYKASKAAANMVGACYSAKFREHGWKVNCCCPGLRKTAFNNYLERAMDVEEGAANAVRLATLGSDGPTGTFSNIDGEQPW